MKFLVNGDFNNHKLLQTILLFVLIYTVCLWFTNVLLYTEKIGFTKASVIEYYLGREEEFRNPVSYRGLLEGTHSHFFTFAIALLLVNHLTVFLDINQRLKFLLILVSCISGFFDITSGWLIRFVSPMFAYLKIVSFVLFQTSFLFLLIFSFMSLKIYRKGNLEDP